ncbi:hypothetical protein BD289DRAFT_437041 [Coniella lustricola]|uniref:Secreted protein n=1 Tax=Coniella lustricola TaxID=2025994 RepID=A0A2T3A4H7_9PEZI|nr:hypothetical protein BD289DRAFT_437041 [Coniella lustricola]
MTELLLLLACLPAMSPLASPTSLFANSADFLTKLLLVSLNPWRCLPNRTSNPIPQVQTDARTLDWQSNGDNRPARP